VISRNKKGTPLPGSERGEIRKGRGWNQTVLVDTFFILNTGPRNNKLTRKKKGLLGGTKRGEGML